jgi:sortase A
MATFHRKTLFLSSFIMCLILIGAAMYLIISGHQQVLSDNTVQEPAAAVSSNDSSPDSNTSSVVGALDTQSAHASGLPATLIIPKIKLNTHIQIVGINKAGNMDVPNNLTDVAWYKYGPRPGEPGNAVIDGHFNTDSQKPAVFWNLRNLQIGDDVYVVDDQQKKIHFQVIGKEVFNAKSAPRGEIFGTTSATHLNLITCSFNDSDARYTDRLVVFTELVP